MRICQLCIDIKGKSYKAVINSSRDEIGRKIYNDLKIGESEKDYLLKVEAVILKLAVSELSKLGFTASGNILKLISGLTKGVSEYIISEEDVIFIAKLQGIGVTFHKALEILFEMIDTNGKISKSKYKE